jgi:hypothetical protein
MLEILVVGCCFFLLYPNCNLLAIFFRVSGHGCTFSHNLGKLGFIFKSHAYVWFQIILGITECKFSGKNEVYIFFLSYISSHVSERSVNYTAGTYGMNTCAGFFCPSITTRLFFSL